MLTTAQRQRRLDADIRKMLCSKCHQPVGSLVPLAKKYGLTRQAVSWRYRQLSGKK